MLGKDWMCTGSFARSQAVREMRIQECRDRGVEYDGPAMNNLKRAYRQNQRAAILRVKFEFVVDPCAPDPAPEPNRLAARTQLFPEERAQTLPVLRL